MKTEYPKPFVLSLIPVVIGNLFPLVGVTFFGWSVWLLVMLYWFENLVLGAANFCKMLTAQESKLVFPKKEGPRDTAWKILRRVCSRQTPFSSNAPLSLFFMIHYGGFCLGHLVFITLVMNSQPKIEPQVETAPIQPLWIWITLLGIVITTFISLWHSYYASGEFKYRTPGGLMFEPYGMIVVLHLGLMFFATQIGEAGNPVLLLAILVVGKTVVDVFLRWIRQLLLSAVVEGTI